MIEVLECLCADLEHVAVNAGLIDTVAEAFPDEICVCCEATHGSHLRRALGDRHRDRIRWIDAAIPDRRAGFAARMPREYQLLRRAGASQPRWRLLLSAHRSLLWALRARLELTASRRVPARWRALSQRSAAPRVSARPPCGRRP